LKVHFTVVFESPESCDNSFGLVFTPCPVWVRGETDLINLHPENPHYLKGDLIPLIKSGFMNRSLIQDEKVAVVVVHSTGHGTEDYLSLLLDDLESEGFTVEIVHLGIH